MPLYTKYRPRTFDRVVGNREAIRSLTTILEQDTLPHAFLFHGPSGCGKTTIARILSRALGCEDIGYKEINAADFRGIDSVRDVIRESHLRPIAGKSRVWVIDECHQLSRDAQNALLKILEDSPEHAFFILCTTDPQKVIPTVRNRCVDLRVELLDEEQITEILARVAEREGVELPEEMVEGIVRESMGSPRSALVLLETVRGLSGKEMEKVLERKASELNQTRDLCQALLAGANWGKVTKIMKGLTDEPETVRRAVLGYMSSVLLNNPKPDRRAALCVEAFSTPTYDTGRAGLVRACVEVMME